MSIVPTPVVSCLPIIRNERVPSRLSPKDRESETGSKSRYTIRDQYTSDRFSLVYIYKGFSFSQSLG